MSSLGHIKHLCIARDKDVNFSCEICKCSANGKKGEKGKKAQVSCRRSLCTVCWRKYCISMGYDHCLSDCANEMCKINDIDPKIVNQYNIEGLLGITKIGFKCHISATRRHQASKEAKAEREREEEQHLVNVRKWLVFGQQTESANIVEEIDQIEYLTTDDRDNSDIKRELPMVIDLTL